MKPRQLAKSLPVALILTTVLLLTLTPPAFWLLAKGLNGDNTVIFIFCAGAAGLAAFGDGWVRARYSLVGSLGLAGLAAVLTAVVLPFVILGLLMLGVGPHGD